MPAAKKTPAKKAATPKAADTAPRPAPFPNAETTSVKAVELTPEERTAALAEAAGLQGVSPDQVDVAAARVLNRG